MLSQVGHGQFAHGRLGWDVGVSAEGDWNGCTLASIDRAPGSSLKVVEEPESVVAMESGFIPTILHVGEVFVAVLFAVTFCAARRVIRLAYIVRILIGDIVWSTDESGVAIH